MKVLTFEEIEKKDNLKASYINGTQSLIDELEHLEVPFTTRDYEDILRSFASDKYICNDENYQVTDLKKVEDYKLFVRSLV